MLDLAFLIILIYVIVNANKGIVKETACNVGLVVGILAAILGCVVAVFKSDGRLAFLNLIVAGIAFGLPFAARHLAKLYLDKQVEEYERLEKEQQMRSRNADPIITGYADDNFDDEELRFGKGGYTDPKL